MTMIVEDYCDFETAKLLKEKGFPQQRMEFVVTTRDCSFIVNGNQKVKECAGTRFPYYPYSKLFLYEEDWAVLPTLQMAMKWLREVHKLSVRPRYDEVEDEKERVFYVWFFDILSMKPYKTLVEPEQGYSTYEEACEAAILYCLENLIK